MTLQRHPGLRLCAAIVVALGSQSSFTGQPAAAGANTWQTASITDRPLVFAPEVVETTALSLSAPPGALSSVKPFTVEVRVDQAAGIGAWEFDLLVDPAMVDVTGMTINGFFAAPASCSAASMRCAFALGPWTDGATTAVGALSYGAGAGATGAGTLAYLHLTPKGRKGVTALTMTNALATSISGVTQAVTTASTTVEFGADAARTYLPRISGGPAVLARADDSATLPLPGGEAPAAGTVGGLQRDASALVTYCAPYDVNCDGFIDVRDLQPQAQLFGVISSSVAYSSALDLNADGIIDLEDMAVDAGGWRSTPQQLAGGPPRLGYAVDPAGQVFLRWTLPISPYVAPVYVIRQAFSGTTGYAPTVIGVVNPVLSETLALTLLGSDWSDVRQLSFTTDITGVTVPATFTTVSEMHAAFAANKGNLLALSQMVNSRPNVAVVMGRGFFDTNVNTAAAKYWIRVRGRLLGPVTVDRSMRTILAAPRDTQAFDASGHITTTDPRKRANQQQFAHGTIFLEWTRPPIPQTSPVWMFGYDVYRSECLPANPGVCANPVNFGRINDDPVQPRTNTPSAGKTVTNAANVNATLQPGDPVHNFAFAYADRDRDPDRLYCYRIAARDLLGQPGLPSDLTAGACLRGPDFKGPAEPQPVFAAASELDNDACDVSLTVAWPRDTDAARFEVYRGTPPSGTQSAEWVLLANVTGTNIVISTATNFAISGGYLLTRFNTAGQVLGRSPVDWLMQSTYSPALSRGEATETVLQSRLVFTGAHPTRPTITFTPTVVFTGTRSNQRGDTHSGLDLRRVVYVVDTSVRRGDRYRYRVVPYDARGNMGAPSAPAEMIARQKPGTCLPTPPQFGHVVTDTGVSNVLLYRKFGSDGQPVLISRIPTATWNSSNMTATDFYSPSVEMEVSYELRAENGYGETSGVSPSISKILRPPLALSVKPSQPVISQVQLDKPNRKYRAAVEWSAAGNAAANTFNIYMSKGITAPTNYLSMTLIHSDTAKALEYTKTVIYSDTTGTTNLTSTSKIYRYAFTNDDLSGQPKLNGKDYFWFLVASRSSYVINLGGGEPKPAISSTIQPATFVARVDEPQHDVDTLDASVSKNALQTEAYIEFQKDWLNECCHVVMRSRNGADWTQLTPPFATLSTSVRIADNDNALANPNYTAFFGASVQYQVLKQDAGYEKYFILIPLDDFEHGGSTGEIVAASDVMTVTRTGSTYTTKPGTTTFTGAGIPPSSVPDPAPDNLVFGPISIDVVTATKSGGVWSGYGALRFTTNSGLLTWVRVDFDGITATVASGITGTVTGLRSAGYAKVRLGVEGGACYLVDRANRVKYRLCDVTLDETGMHAAQLILDALGPDVIPWDVSGGIGSSSVHTFTNVTLKNGGLDWEKNLPGNNTCGQNITTASHIVTHADWPILLYPTGLFTYTQSGIEWTTVCTQYRTSRYSDWDSVSNSGGITPHEPGDYDNAGFMKANYTSQNASWSASDGLSGTFNYNGNISYTLAFPFKLKIDANDWRFKFSAGRLTGGHIDDGVVTQAHATDGSYANSQRRIFTATFSHLDVLTNGVVLGVITGTAPLTWTAFGFTGSAQYDLYLPPALTPQTADKSWLAERGDPASGLGETGLGGNKATQNPGINVFTRGLVWNACAADEPIGSAGIVTFAKTSTSGLKLYFRYGGVNGQVNMTTGGATGGGSKSVNLSGYETTVTRFSQSWLDNKPQTGSTLGDLFLPFPVSMTLEMIGMAVNAQGCMQGGPVLPTPGKLNWWNINVVPSAAEWREESNGNVNIWLLGEYQFDNLTRVDGVVNGNTLDDPTVPIELAFRPNGTFEAANAYVQPTVYEINGFYSVIESLKLSDCRAESSVGVLLGAGDRTTPVGACRGPGGGAPWDDAITFRPAPTVTAQQKNYVDIVGSMVFPWFGEVISPSANHIYLLQDANYIGFSQRPKIDSPLSKLMPIGVELDLAYAQGKTSDGSWLGFSKQGSQRTGLQVMESPFAAIITPDNTTLVFGYPALTAAMLGAQQMECQWDAARCGDGTTVGQWDARWDGFRAKLQVGNSNYLAEYTDAKSIANAIQDQVGTLTAYNILDALQADMCAADANPDCTKSEIEAWINANASNAPQARFALLRNVMPDSPFQLQWLRGGVSILGVRDDTGKLVSGKVGVLQLDAYATVFNRQTATSANAAGTQPMFDALVSLDIDVTLNEFKVKASGVDVKLVGNSAQMNIDLDVYMGEPNGYGVHGGIELLNLHLELMDISEADADFGFTVKNNQLAELYLGVTFDARVQTGAFGSLVVGGQMLVGRLDPAHATLQADYADLFDDMNVTPGSVIEGMYLSVYANNIPIVNIAGCVVAELSGGGGLAFWVFTDANQSDTAWGTRVSGFVQGQGGVCLVALAVNADLTLDNGFGQNDTTIRGQLFVAGGCGFCEPEEWITEQGYENDQGCIKCGLDLGFVIPLDGSPAPYMTPEPVFSCSL